MEYELFNNVEEQQYEYHIDNYRPVIEYFFSPAEEILLIHTEVPPPLRGQGIGTSLVKAVLEDIEGQGLRMIPLCPFIKAYVDEHPQWQHLTQEAEELEFA